jgi:hypothetical protein
MRDEVATRLWHLDAKGIENFKGAHGADQTAQI